MKIKNLEDLFNHTLEDIYYAENKLVKALPKMAKASELPGARGGFHGPSRGDEGARHAPR